LDYKHFVIVDPDNISCYLTQKSINNCYPSAETIIFAAVEEALTHLGSQKNSCCLLVENNLLNLPSKTIVSILHQFEEKNYRIIILSNAFQKKLLEIIPKLKHVRFCYKPLTKKLLLEMMRD